ncbi:hypothetical protein [Agrobacterium vaccinii]|uniref:hypothetical protein n=1 Tax=Agrobacterium vaccinii TaxID=2735528 RepID=UPI001E65A60A|nr:hypothetical protein [Agrobacterium vaccinii]UHS55504.1 hypothetical protein HRS00_01040 [Agrobacterium vaccinii]
MHEVVGGDGSSLEAFLAAFAEFEKATQEAVSVSQRNIGNIHTGRQRRALAVFSKFIVHNMAIRSMMSGYSSDPDSETLLDHFSCAVLARSSIDAALMTMYISEPRLSLKQWDFRRQLLYLHDINNRSRFLKPLRKQGLDVPFFDTNEDVKSDIQQNIMSLGPSLLYSQEKIAEYAKGLHLFVDGVRGAARESEWDIDEFEFNQAYLSAYVHSHPVSFMRFDEHDIKFGGASEFQIDFCRYIVTMVTMYTKSVVARMDKFSVPDKGDPNGHLE